MSVPIPTLLLKPEGSRDRNGVVSPVLTGPVRTVEGSAPGSQAWFVEEGTTNLVRNPSFEQDLSTWAFNVISGGGTWERASASLHGGFAAKIVRNSTLGYCYVNTNVLGVTPSVPHTFSATVRVDAPSNRTVNLEIVYWTGDGTTWVASPAQQAELVPGVPQRVSLTSTPPAAFIRVEARLRITHGDRDVSGVYLIDGVQFEARPYATSYCDGSLGAGYSWAGPAHASASTRAWAVLSAPAGLDFKRGSLLIRARNETGNGAGNRYLFHGGDFSVPDFLALTFAESRVRSWTRAMGEGATSPALPSPVVGAGDVFSVYHDWTESRVRLSVNGSPILTGPRTQPGGNKSAAFWIGAYSSAQQSANAIFDAVLLFDRPLTDAERAELLAMTSWRWDRFGGRTLSYGAVT